MKYLAIIFLFISCNGITGRNTPPVVTEAVDTLQAVPPNIVAAPLLFEQAFVKGTTQNVKGVSSSFYGVNIGNIKVSSGRLIACDPMHIDEYGIPFTQQFPNGEFPVHLSIAKFEDGERIAFARVQFSEEPVAKWQFAMKKGEEPMPIDGKKKYGYSTDTGTGIYIDEAAAKAFDREQAADMDTGIYKEMDKHYHHRWRYTIYNFGSHNLAAFSTGLGDGYYGTYIGFDANGRPCRLLTDFGLYEWREN